MRRFLTLVCLLCLAIPAGISVSGCFRNPGQNYCNGLGYGLKDTDVTSIYLQPQIGGISLAFGQTQQIKAPSALTCKGAGATVNTSQYTYGTTNNRLVDVSPTGNICAGTWNRNTGGGIPDYTICNYPTPSPTTKGLPYGIAYITAAIDSVVSNPVQVFVHPQVTSVSLVGPQQCFSQGQQELLDSQACFSNNGKQELLCKPPSLTDPTQFACPLPPGVTTVSDCSQVIGTFTYAVENSSVATINQQTNQITAQLPGTTAITASIAGSGSSAGYFSTCPAKSIKVTLANGATSGVVTQGVQQNLTTVVTDTSGNQITGLSLDYQSTNPINITAGAAGAISARFPGIATVNAVCQPAVCNPSPINEVGLNGTGVSISSNPVRVITPGTVSNYVWFASPGNSQYFVPILLLTGTTGSTVRLPYVPNSMVMDEGGNNLYFGSLHELMVYSTTTNAITGEDPSVPGVVLAVSPNNSQVLINDQIRGLFYIRNATGSGFITFGGLGAAAQWTPDSKTLYIVDRKSLNNPAAGITGHTDTLYVYNQNTGWSTYDLTPSGGATSVAITVPGVGAYLDGSPTVAHTWCPTGTVGNTASMTFYPQVDSEPIETDALAATTDGQHILGAGMAGGGITLSDIGVTIPTTACPSSTTGTGSNQVQTLLPLPIQQTLLLNQYPLTGINATSVSAVVASPVSNLAFITYNGSTPGALLPYYITGPSGSAGTVHYVTLAGGSAVTAPLTGVFSPDDTTFFVSTAGDNKIHFISIPTSLTSTTQLQDTQQLSPKLPACTPVSAGGNDLGCTYTGSNPIVPVTAIAVVPRPAT
ncbi:MAG: hypothetical protein ACLGRW_12430 [Acidobacteriota bacterium]